MSDCEKYYLLFSVLLILILWLFYKNKMVKVYRFYKTSCPYCVSSEEEWNKFKSLVRFDMVVPIDVDNSNTSPEHLEFARNFGVKGVPTIWKVCPDGKRYEYTGDRSALDIYKFATETP
jgi:hypothetical protein